MTSYYSDLSYQDEIEEALLTKNIFKEEPIQLIDSSEGKLNINEKGIDILKSVGKPLVIVGVAGLYRTGKSYLLNKMILNRKSGFETKGTVNSCTKGIWMWGKPIKYERKSGDIINIIVLDSEGLAAVDQDKEHDSRIFSLVLLLSSVFIYNGTGTIVNDSIEDDATEEDYAEFMPDFVWVLRDFILDLVDIDGNPITPNEYLENALEEREGDDEIILEKNRIRRVIRGCFKNRDCFPLLRPVINENQLQNLETLEDYELRQEFVEQIELMRNKLFSEAETKKLNGNELSGAMMSQLIEQYVEKMNGNDVPVVQNIWDYICEENCNKVFENCLKNYKKMMKEVRGTMSNEDIHNIHLNCLETILECEGSKKKNYRDMLIQRAEEVETQLKKNNELNFKQEIVDLMEEHFNVLEKQLMLSQDETYSSILQKLEDIEKNILEETVNGPKRNQIISEKILEFTHKLGSLVFDKRERRFKKLQNEQNEKNQQLINEIKDQEKKFKEEIENFKESKRKLEGNILELKRTNQRIEDKTAKIIKKNEIKEQSFKEKLDEKDEILLKEKEQWKSDMDLLNNKLKSLMEKKMKEEGDKERNYKMKEQNVIDLKNSLEQLKKDFEDEIKIKNDLISLKEKEISDMILLNQKKLSEKNDMIRKMENENEEIVENKEALEREIKNLKKKAEDKKSFIEKLIMEKEEIENKLLKNNSSIVQTNFESELDDLKIQNSELKENLKTIEEEMEDKEREYESELKKIQLESNLLQQQISQLKNKISISEKEREESYQNYLNLLNAKNNLNSEEDEDLKGTTKETEMELEKIRAEKQIELEEKTNKIEELNELIEKLESEAEELKTEYDETKTDLESRLENERQEKENLRKKMQEQIWSLENEKEEIEEESKIKIRQTESDMLKKLEMKEEEYLNKNYQMDKLMMEQKEILEKELSNFREQNEESKKQFSISRNQLIEKHENQMLDQISQNEQECRKYEEKIEALQNVNAQLEYSYTEIMAKMREIEEISENKNMNIQSLEEQIKLKTQEINEKEIDFENERENFEKELQNLKEKQRIQIEKLGIEIEEKDEEIENMKKILKENKNFSSSEKNKLFEEIQNYKSVKFN